MKHSVFSGQGLVLLVTCAIALFALSVLLHAYDNSPVSRGSRAGPGSYSTSAIGYAGLHDTLRRLGRPVTRSVGNTLSLVGDHGILVLAEPDQHRLGREETRALTNAPHLLLILPKWLGKPDPGRPAWISEAAPCPLESAQRTLFLITARAEVFRAERSGEWKNNAVGIRPTEPDVVQLMRSDRLLPVVGDANGMLVGEFVSARGTVWVLSDPDIASNHGIIKGDNAAFMTALLDMLGMRNKKSADASHTGAPIVFDETVHGYEAAQGTPVKLLFRFPFVIATALLAATALLLVLAGGGRFGPPRQPKRGIAFGKGSLIENGARLLDYAGHHVPVLQRYIAMTIRITAAALHAPSRNARKTNAPMNETDLMDWLDRIGEARGVTRSCESIAREAAGLNSHTLSRLLACARDIHTWKGEILDGSAHSRINRHQRP